MARRRRRYHHEDEATPDEAHEGDALAHAGDDEAHQDDGDAGDGPQGDEAPKKAEDRSCLTHPGYEARLACARCKAAVCEMCAVTIHGRALCAECLGVELAGEQPAEPWRGFAAALVGLVTVAGVTLPWAVGTQAPWMAKLPGGPTFFLYLGLAGGALSVGAGLVAQDFAGVGKRAGWVGVVLGLVALALVLGVNALRVLGSL
jgi:hypothetical protein